MPIRDDDPPELRRRLLGSPTVVAEAAMRLAWQVEKQLGETDRDIEKVNRGLEDMGVRVGKDIQVLSRDIELNNLEVKRQSARIDLLEGRIIASLGRIEHRLGLVEKKAPEPPITTPELQGSMRPISYHELPNALAEVLPELERRQSVAWWMGFIDGMKDAFRRGVKKGAVSAVAALVVAAALLAAGYAIRDCSHAIVHQGQTREIPKIRPIE